MSVDKYPSFVRQYMNQLKQRGLTMDEIIAAYEKVFETSALGKAAQEQFPSASTEEILQLRQRFAIGKVWRDYINLAPLEEVEIIYVGHDGLNRSTGSGKKYCNMYVIVQKSQSALLTRMNARGKYAELFRALNPFTKYRATLGRYQTGDSLLIDHRTKFNDPEPVVISIDQFNKILNIPTVSVAEAVKYPSKTQTDGYMVDTDWRCIMGYFSGEPRTFQPKGKKGIRRGVCNITDLSVKEGPTIDQQGRPRSPGMTAWIAQEHLIWDEDSFLAFYGPIKVTKDKETKISTASMNCYCVRPIIATEMEIEDE